MNYKYRIIFSVIILSIVWACGSKSTETEDDVEWKAMDDFHTIMADVYHPLKDSNDLVPIKGGSGKLSAEATKWRQSGLPDKVNDKETEELIAKLEDGCQELDDLVKANAADSVIAAKLTETHDQFHAIMEKWHKSGSEEGHKH